MNADGSVFSMARWSVRTHSLDLAKFSLLAAALGSFVSLSLLADQER